MGVWVDCSTGGRDSNGVLSSCKSSLKSRS